MITREQLEARRDALDQSIAALTQQIDELDQMRQDALANLHTLSGARQLIDEFLTETPAAD